MTAVTSAPLTSAPVTSTPAVSGGGAGGWSGLPRHGLLRRARPEHADWCVHHGASGCEGQIFALPGTRLLVWMSAPSGDDPRLVVEGPDGIVQLPVQA
jgi:hypothetical protein